MKTWERMLRQSLTPNATPTNATPSSNVTPSPPTTNTSLQKQANEQATKITSWLFDLFNRWLPTDVANLIVIVLVLAVAWYAAKGATRLLEPRITRRFERPSVSRTVLRSIRMGILGLGVLFVITNFSGIDTADIVLQVTVVSAMAGVVLAPIVGSIVSGLFVLADQPYEVGDLIELTDTGQRGFVKDITIRYTKVITLDNTFLVIPNGSMRERDVVNHSAEDSRTRQEVEIGVTYESDIDTARTLIEEAAREVDDVIDGGPAIRVGSSRYPAGPMCFIAGFGDHSVKLQMRYWVTEPYKQHMIRSRVLERVWSRLQESDVELAYPHSHLVFDETSGVLNVDLTEETADERSQHRSTRSGPHTND